MYLICNNEMIKYGTITLCRVVCAFHNYMWYMKNWGSSSKKRSFVLSGIKEWLEPYIHCCWNWQLIYSKILLYRNCYHLRDSASIRVYRYENWTSKICFYNRYNKRESSSKFWQIKKESVLFHLSVMLAIKSIYRRLCLFIAYITLYVYICLIYAVMVYY